MRKSWLKVLGAGLVAVGLMAPLTVLAHAKLLATSPVSGAALTAAPKTLTLKFNEAVQIAVLKLSVAGKDVPLSFDRNAASSDVSVALPALAAGSYQVQWSALTVDDGHVVKGSFSFTVATP
jgi:methionine-rich copper-binding protein CopC